MHQDRWREIVNQIKDNFSVEEHEKFAGDNSEETELIVFDSPLGKVKLEFNTRPKVIDKKVSYSNRIGSEASVEFIYSAEEKVCQLLVYRWSEADNDWVPFENSMFN